MTLKLVGQENELPHQRKEPFVDLLKDSVFMTGLYKSIKAQQKPKVTSASKMRRMG